ncbi:MAG: hypothetical protein S4CHLAM2_05760 [Chlamydiales bacterium]|nr:hypothetical protein [Chlamydiales bacterium]
MKTLTSPSGQEIVYQGLGPEAGPLPAFFYFALSGEESLTLEPYSSPATLLKGAPLRVFSITIPGHGPGFDKFHAIQYWADQMAQENYLLETFFDEVVHSISWLIESQWIDPEHIAVGGLSRGGFIATHVAARETRIKTVLGFAPLTRLDALSEFTSDEHNKRVKMRAQALNLDTLIDALTHVHHLRFYIGNRDERVSTDACYHFIRKLSDKAHERRTRHMNVELRIAHSIGHKGHGTAPSVFEEGANWIEHLLR